MKHLVLAAVVALASVPACATNSKDVVGGAVMGAMVGPFAVAGLAADGRHRMEPADKAATVGMPMAAHAGATITLLVVAPPVGAVYLGVSALFGSIWGALRHN